MDCGGTPTYAIHSDCPAKVLDLREEACEGISVGGDRWTVFLATAHAAALRDALNALDLKEENDE
jgi:hypothetical protein